jgi:two-component system OmpR family response regulator
MENEFSILVVDDEIGIRELICDALSVAEIKTQSAADGLEALDKIRKVRFDLVILDINLPTLDGLSLIEKIRKEDFQVPVLMLSARGERSDITAGLKSGADDYLTKPFGIEELVLRVRAILRRTNSAASSHKELVCGPIKLDLDQYRASFNGEIVDLSVTEFRLLEALIMRAGKVVTKENLLATVWGIDFKNNSTVVDTYISYLRKKLHKEGFDGIKTIRGIGFQILGDK